MIRQKLGDGSVHIGGDFFVANAGVVEFDPLPNSGVGTTSHRDPATDPIPFPPTPASSNVYPIEYASNMSDHFDSTGRWKGIQEGEA